MAAHRPRQPDALPRLHNAEAIAAALGCSARWVKDRARLRQIPFVLVGGSYRFTDQHLTEIIAIFEKRPDQPRGQAVSSNRRRLQPQQVSETVVPLRARPPQRARKTG
jgi:hypothetical protein